MHATSITVSSGGFLGLYMLGVATHLKGCVDLSSSRIGGVSAGACVAGFLLSEESNEEWVRSVILPRICNDLTARPGLRQAWGHVPDLIRTLLSDMPDLDATRGFVAVTRVSSHPPFVEREIKENFVGLEQYIDYAILSAFVPVLCGHIARSYGDHYYMDGALTSRVPIPTGHDACDNLFIHPGMFGREFSWRDCSNISPYRAYRLFALGRQDAQRHEAQLRGMFSASATEQRTAFRTE